MKTITASEARRNLYKLMDETAVTSEPVQITGKRTSDSSKWVHEELGIDAFAWQEGYGAFTISKSDLVSVRQYVQGQEEHYRKRSFQEEHRALLERHGIEFDKRYLR
jgi:hypothetical protein